MIGHRLFLAIRVLFALMFVGAAGLKLTDMESFAGTIGDIGWTWSGWEDEAAVGLVVAEFSAGFMFLFNIRFASILLGGLLVLFTSAAAYSVAIGLDIDCGCFGRLGLPGVGMWNTIVRNVILIGLLAAATWMRRHLGYQPVGYRYVPETEKGPSDEEV